MQTRRIFYKSSKNDAVSKYFGDHTHNFKSMRNVAMFYIRNTMTGIQKKPEERTRLENEVLENVFHGIEIANEKQLNLFKKSVLEARTLSGMYAHAYIYAALRNFIEPPTAEHWFLSYKALDKIFKAIDHPNYRSLPSQVAQKAIKKTVASWSAYFKAKKAFTANPSKFNGSPCIPGYIKVEKSTMEIPTQTAKITNDKGKAYIQFPLLPNHKVCVGKENFYAGKHVKTEIKPYKDGYYILITTDDNHKTAERPEKPACVLGIDPGLDNFLTCAGNFSAVPFIILGGYLKSINRQYNKERARLMSELTSGQDSRHSVKNSKRLNALDRKSDCVIRDFFYKAAHYICRHAEKHHVEAIVIGHTKGQKNELSIGHVNTQNFYSIPYAQFCDILLNVADKYGIYAIAREESYTLKASATDGDVIPTYKENCKSEYTFSGKRIFRGQYKTAGGRTLNADVNGALNIARKEFPDAFKGASLEHAFGSVKTIGFKDLYPQRKKQNGSTRDYHLRRTEKRRLLHGLRQKQRLMYRVFFDEIQASNKKQKAS